MGEDQTLDEGTAEQRTATNDAAAENDEGGPPDLSERVLCPDGGCIGVIGPDGRCKVCGTVYEAPAAAAAPTPPAEQPAREDAPDAVGDGDDEIDLAARVLCSDGGCIGVIGPDGRCKECGKPYTGEAGA